MQGDFSRLTHDPAKHFLRVLTQQGRVQLDADANEQTAILLRYLQALAADLIGPYAASGDGFKIITSNSGDFDISNGNFYVDGILCENNNEYNIANDKKFSYAAQPDYLPLSDSAKLESLGSPGVFVYLDVWERYISSAIDDSIREVALGGADTAGRSKVIWQVKLLPADITNIDLSKYDDPGKPDLELAYKNAIEERFKPLRITPPMLVPILKPPPKSSLNVDEQPGKYVGVDNRLYRVEIHTGSFDADGKETISGPTFKWSRDNGSVVTRLKASDDTSATVENARGFEPKQWVELLDDGCELFGIPGVLRQIASVEDNVLSFASPNPEQPNSSTFTFDKNKNPFVRRWDQTGNEAVTLSTDDNAIPIPILKEDPKAPVWIDVEDGIQIAFKSYLGTARRTYRTGDYWLIPVRAATQTIDWPTETFPEEGKPATFAPQLPFGIEHHYAPLALLTMSTGSVATNAQDLRRKLTLVSERPF